MRAGVSIRTFAPADLPVLQEIRAAAFAPVFRGFREAVGPAIAAIALVDAEADQARLLEEICAEASPWHMLVAESEGRPIGFAAWRWDQPRRSGEIGLNAVHPDHGGRGVGTALYERALTELKALGAAVVEVGTGGDAAHAPARRAYAKAGFGAAIPSLTLYRQL